MRRWHARAACRTARTLPLQTSIHGPIRRRRERDLLWLDDVDRQVQAVHIRQFLATPAAAREEGLRIFLQRQLLKPDKQNVRP